MKICLSQSNPIVGDFSYNSQLIIDAAQFAFNKQAHFLITPELSLTGYPPEDLLLRDSFIEAAQNELLRLVKFFSKFKGLYVAIGHPEKSGHKILNKLSILFEGQIVASYAKQKLPNSEVFDELRYFAPGNETVIINVDCIKIGLLICEDIWFPDPALEAKEKGAQLLISVNASPFHTNKQISRIGALKQRALETRLPIIYLNAVGGQDELIFDGASFAVNEHGNISHMLKEFKTDLAIIDFDDFKKHSSIDFKSLCAEGRVYNALVLGIRDYVVKNNFSGVIIGLSGGVDSALVTALAVDALGPKKVKAVMMPSNYTAEISLLDARSLAKNLNIEYTEISINNTYKSIEESLYSEFKNLPTDVTEENIQARIRGLFLMALSNKTGNIVLATGNKSEIAVGYCTLYGDMAGGFAVIKDVPKTLVYKLCKYRNRIKETIPDRILTRAPSAELKDNQKDQDSLPEYEILDEIIYKYVEENQSVNEIIKSGFNEEDVIKITTLIRANEYKRRQSAVGIRITPRAFGRDWRYPITNKFKQ